MVLDESGEAGQTALKMFLIEALRPVYGELGEGVEESFAGQPRIWTVHHINTQHGNNKLDNLALMTNAAHSAYHKSSFALSEEELRKWMNKQNEESSKYKNQVIIIHDHIKIVKTH